VNPWIIPKTSHFVWSLILPGKVFFWLVLNRLDPPTLLLICSSFGMENGHPFLFFLLIAKHRPVVFLLYKITISLSLTFVPPKKKMSNVPYTSSSLRQTTLSVRHHLNKKNVSGKRWCNPHGQRSKQDPNMTCTLTSWLVHRKRTSYPLAYELITEYNWLGFHPLYQKLLGHYYPL